VPPWAVRAPAARRHAHVQLPRRGRAVQLGAAAGDDDHAGCHLEGRRHDGRLGGVSQVRREDPGGAWATGQPTARAALKRQPCSRWLRWAPASTHVFQGVHMSWWQLYGLQRKRVMPRLTMVPLGGLRQQEISHFEA
jgi:hypothetical protein